MSFSRLALLFSLAPILRGFIAMFISGTFYPLCGVMILRMDLVPMRYMLMHGVILGGAISLAINLPIIPVTVVLNLLLIFIMMGIMRTQSFGFSGASAAVMVLSMAAASIIMHVADVPAKDTLSLMWGSPFALTVSDLICLGVLALLLVLYVILNFRTILALFFNKEIARSMGIKVNFHYTVMVLLIAVVVALAMKLLGAFLIDSLLLLPVLSASSINRKGSGGIKRLFIVSCIFGCGLSVIGYVTAVIINWPPAATISVLAGLVYLICIEIKALRTKKLSLRA
ncbi:MAG: metal ABC transporter permease [Treponema sp.]|nr:metal ABC transporter permease [Treponema sp.]